MNEIECRYIDIFDVYGLGNSIKQVFNPYFNVNIKITLRKQNLAHKCFVLTCVEYGKHPRTSK